MPETVGEVLNAIILHALGWPRGDPDFHHHLAAAGAFRALKMLGLPVQDEVEIRNTLRNAQNQGNLFDTDFLEEVGWPRKND